MSASPLKSYTITLNFSGHAVVPDVPCIDMPGNENACRCFANRLFQFLSARPDLLNEFTQPITPRADFKAVMLECTEKVVAVICGAKFHEIRHIRLTEPGCTRCGGSCSQPNTDS